MHYGAFALTDEMKERPVHGTRYFYMGIHVFAQVGLWGTPCRVLGGIGSVIASRWNKEQGWSTTAMSAHRDYYFVSGIRLWLVFGMHAFLTGLRFYLRSRRLSAFGRWF